jgi:hypothetical protein
VAFVQILVFNGSTVTESCQCLLLRFSCAASLILPAWKVDTASKDIATDLAALSCVYGRYLW